MYAPSRSIDKRKPHDGFEALDLLAQRGLRNSEPRRCPLKVSFFDQCDKIPKVS